MRHNIEGRLAHVGRRTRAAAAALVGAAILFLALTLWGRVVAAQAYHGAAPVVRADVPSPRVSWTQGAAARPAPFRLNVDGITQSAVAARPHEARRAFREAAQREAARYTAGGPPRAGRVVATLWSIPVVLAHAPTTCAHRARVGAC